VLVRVSFSQKYIEFGNSTFIGLLWRHKARLGVGGCGGGRERDRERERGREGEREIEREGERERGREREREREGGREGGGGGEERKRGREAKREREGPIARTERSARGGGTGAGVAWQGGDRWRLTSEGSDEGPSVTPHGHGRSASLTRRHLCPAGTAAPRAAA
jgi:hypothetical protein